MGEQRQGTKKEGERRAEMKRRKGNKRR